MLRNYLTIAFRNLLRNKVFSAINIFGLAIGMAICLLIFLWVNDELSYDRFHANNRDLYRVMETQFYEGKTENYENTPGLLAEALKKDMPEIKHAVTMMWNIIPAFRTEQKLAKETGGYASADFFKMYSFPLLKGDPKTVLSSPRQIVISRKLTEKYFGSTDVLGKIVTVGKKEVYQIAGVFEDVPLKSSLQFDFVIPMEKLAKEEDWLRTWNNNGPLTHVQLRPDADVEKVNRKLKNYLATKQKGMTTELFLQPYGEQYLYNRFVNGKPMGGRIEYVRLFSIVAVFVLLIACVNFMNLSTARFSRRAKEVGIRKVLGSGWWRLVALFMGEAFLMVFLAIIVALLLTQMLVPFFNDLTQKNLVIPFRKLSFWFFMLLFVGFTSLFAGSYPALFLSSLKTLPVLKNTLKIKPGAVLFRKSLVVFQFSLSVILMVATLIVYGQVRYLQTKSLGFDRENVVVIYNTGKQYQAFKTELSRLPGIKDVSGSRESPPNIGSSTSGIGWEGKNARADVLFYLSGVSYDFLKTLRIPLVAGRDFSPDFAADSSSVVINQKAAEAMGMKDPVGKVITLGNQKVRIIGVTQDFHLRSLHYAIEPLILFLDRVPDWGPALIRTQPGQTRQALASIGKAFRKVMPQIPFEFQFMDDSFARLYRSETLVGKLAGIFASLAVFISCLGLFGLAAFTAEARTKEIGIRKVLGASVNNIVALLSKDFLKLVLIAFAIAVPIAWYFMYQWLQDFAYRIEFSWWVFALAGMIALLIALLTVSFQAVRAALTNPVKSLRSE